MLLSIVILSSIYIGFNVLSLLSTTLSVSYLIFCKDLSLWYNSLFILGFNILNLFLLAYKKNLVNNIITYLPINLTILIFTISNTMKQENKFNLFYLITSIATQIIVLSYNFNLIGYLYSNNLGSKNEIILQNNNFDNKMENGNMTASDDSNEYEGDYKYEDDAWGYYVDTETNKIIKK